MMKKGIPQQGYTKREFLKISGVVAGTAVLPSCAHIPRCMGGESLESELKRSRIVEVAKDVWMIEGYVSDSFFSRCPSSNIYILRDKADVYILDTGFHGIYRDRILSIVNRLRKDGAKRVTLLITQGHFDHAFNNDIVLETGMEWRFLLPEPEVGRTSSFSQDAIEDLERLSGYEDVFTAMLPWRWPTGVVRATSSMSHALGWKLLKSAFSHLMDGATTLADKAQVLKLEDRITRHFGSVEVPGWDVGPFFLIHDASHTPGHVCLYDQERKLMLAGDVTIEINPAFFYSSTKRCQEVSGWLRKMSEEGFVELAGDSHRTSTYLPTLLDKFQIDIMHPTEALDFMRGKDQCVAFFGFFEKYYERLQEEVLAAHMRCGRSTVNEVVEEVRASKDPYMRGKCNLCFPEFPSRLDVLVASVLREEGITPQKEDDRIVFEPRVLCSMA